MTTRVNNGLLFDVSFLNYHFVPSVVLWSYYVRGLTLYVVLHCTWSYFVRGHILYKTFIAK